MVKNKTKKIALIVSFRNFQDEEYFVPKNIFEKEGFSVKTISTSSGFAVGASGGDVKVDLLLEQLNIEDFDAVVFVGGLGAYKYIDDPLAHQICKKTIKKGRVLGAICIAPAILSRAGVLEKKTATVWSSALDKGAIKILKEGGAIYENKPVVSDGNIVTANGPDAAGVFAQRLVEAINA